MLAVLRGVNSACYLTGSALQILRSSKNPSLPMQPNSTFDFVGWAMPGDCINATGLPSMEARMVWRTPFYVRVERLSISVLMEQKKRS